MGAIEHIGQFFAVPWDLVVGLPRQENAVSTGYHFAHRRDDPCHWMCWECDAEGPPASYRTIVRPEDAALIRLWGWRFVAVFDKNIECLAVKCPECGEG